MGILSALFHGAGEHQSEVIQVGFDSTNLMAARGDERTQRYYNHMIAVLPRAAREALEMKMMSEFRYYDEFLRDANSKGKVESVLRVLEARGVAVDGRQRARIEACGDPEQLDVWLDRAALATTVDELFD